MIRSKHSVSSSNYHLAWGFLYKGITSEQYVSRKTKPQEKTDGRFLSSLQKLRCFPTVPGQGTEGLYRRWGWRSELGGPTAAFEVWASPGAARARKIWGMRWGDTAARELVREN